MDRNAYLDSMHPMDEQSGGAFLVGVKAIVPDS